MNNPEFNPINKSEIAESLPKNPELVERAGDFDVENFETLTEQEQQEVLGEFVNDLENFTENPPTNTTETNPKARTLFSQIMSELKAAGIFIEQYYRDGKNSEALTMARKFVVDTAQSKTTEYFNEHSKEWFKDFGEQTARAETEPNLSKREKMLKLALDGVDFIPVVGSAKMLSEGLSGRTMSGEKLDGKKRLVHTMEGAVFLAIDLTGYGALATTGVKSVKLFRRSGALMRTMGISREASMAVFKTGKYIAQNPELAKAADKSLEYIIRGRSKRKINWSQEVPNTVLDEQEREMEKEETKKAA